MVFWSSGSRVRRVIPACAFALLAALCLRAPSAAADITPGAQKVVDHYLQAIGGRAAFDAVESVHGKGKVTAFGFTGAIETWTARPDKRASKMEIGPLKVQQGYDGTTAWRTDPSGKVIVLDGLDRQRSIASTWFDANRWLEADQAGGKVSLAKDEDVEGPYDVLLVESPGGEKRHIWVNRDTGLIDKIVAKEDQRTATSTLSDYRPFAGVLFPLATHTVVEGMHANDITVAFDTLEVNGDLSGAPFSPPGGGGPAVRYLKQNGIARLPFDYSARHLWVRASVNGNPPADFIYDTGASITVIDSTYAAKIGLEARGSLQGQGAGATGSASLAKLDDLKVSGDDGDGVEMTSVPVAVLSINPAIEPFLWKPVAGVIGFNFISQFVNEIDYDTGTLVLHDPKTFKYEGKGEAIPMELAGTVPAIQMTIDGKYKGKFRVDVGSSATVDLHRPFVEANGIDKKVKKSIEIVNGGFGGTFTSRVIRMKSVAIGPYSWKHPVISLSGATTGALASADYAGNIGNRILERFKCTFDYDHRILHLEPGARYAQPDHFTRTGLQLMKKDGKFVIAQVIKGSPAKKAGLEVGDEVLAIDDKPAGDWRRSDLDKLFEDGKPGRKVTFSIAREGRAMNVTLKLHDVI